MKILRQCLILVILVSAFSLSSCLASGTTKPANTIADMPTLTQAEVCAMAYNYLENQADAMTVYGNRLSILDFFSSDKQYFTASYKGNDMWQVLAVGNDDVGTSGKWGYAGSANDPNDGLWNVFEKSGVIEPANDKAQALLSYMQYWNRP